MEDDNCNLIRNVSLRLNQTKQSSSKIKVSSLRLKQCNFAQCLQFPDSLTFSWMYLHLHYIDPKSAYRCR